MFPCVAVSGQLPLVAKHALTVPLIFLSTFAAPVFLPIVPIFFVSSAPFKCQASGASALRLEDEDGCFMKDFVSVSTSESELDCICFLSYQIPGESIDQPAVSFAHKALRI